MVAAQRTKSANYQRLQALRLIRHGQHGGRVCYRCAGRLLASRIKCPAEVCFFPALLPMIPGIYAYRTIEALFSCLYYTQGNSFAYYFHLLAYNGLTCTFII